MEGLELQYEVIREGINSIQKLPADYPAAARPSVASEGQSIKEIEQLADLYVSLHINLVTLSEETVKYLDSMIEDFRETDEKKQ